MIGVGLLGAGYAASMQLTGWARVPNARVVGLWNLEPDQGRFVADRFGVPFVERLDDLLANPEIDAIDVATAPTSHLELARKAAQAGKAVLCQKPMARAFDECQAIVADCDEAGVRLMINENFRWRAWYRAARTVLDEGALGRLFHLSLTFRRSLIVASSRRPAEQIFAGQPRLRADDPLMLLSNGPHFADLVRFLFGDPETIYCRADKVTPYVAGEEIMTMVASYPDRTAIVDASFASVGYEGGVQPDTVVIEGTDGTLRIDTDGQVRVHDREGDERVIAVDAEDWDQASWTAALAHFAGCLEQGRPFETDGARNLETMRIVFAGIESARTGRPVPLADLR